MKNSIMLAAASAIALSSVSSVAVARDHVEIVGSSTVYPFATVVAEQYGRKSGSTPKIESTGSGGGLKLFCNGMGAIHLTSPMHLAALSNLRLISAQRTALKILLKFALVTTVSWLLTQSREQSLI